MPESTVSRCAGIDIGSEAIFVAVTDEPVRRFATFTTSLVEAAAYLKRLGVERVAVEATGLLWLPLYEILEPEGFELFLVNPAHARMIAGRKSDVSDSQWLEHLLRSNLLRKSFIPDEATRALRGYVRLRSSHISMGAQHVQHMQKALDAMNLKLHTVISQIHGASGLRILDAIVAGQRDPQRLATLADARIRTTKHDQVVAALTGNYRPEHVFALAQALQAWRFYQQQMHDCDTAIGTLLQEHTRELPPPSTPDAPAKPMRHNRPEIDGLHTMLRQMLGEDVGDPTILPGITDKTLLELTSELGTDLSRWPTSRQFARWTTLAPGSSSSGKRVRHIQQGSAHRVAQIFRLSAQSIAASKSLALKGFYNRIRARSGPRVAITATARKLAVMYYNFIRYGSEYIETGLEAYEQNYRERRIKSLQRQATELGLRLLPA
jgi:transposase